MTVLTDKDGNEKERQAFDPWGNRREPDDWTSLITTPVSNITARGYTMHEHLDGFALINMNGRVYDPQIARFLSPDPQLQAPGYWLNYNRYGYALNNPLMYTDPSGEFFVEAIMLGMYIYTGIQGATGNLQNGGDFLTALAVGGLSGAAGGFAGHAASGAFGIATSTGGAGGAWAGGSSFEQGLLEGFRGGVFGAFGGAVIGGLSGGYKHLKLKSRVSAIMANSSIETSADRSLMPSTKTANEFSDVAFKEYDFLKKVNNIYEAGYVEDINPKYDAFTVKTPINGKYNIYYAEAAFKSPFRLYLAMGHEYIHVAHLSLYGSNWNKNLSEYAAYRWNYKVSKSSFYDKMALDHLNPKTVGKRLLNSYTDVYRFGIGLDIPNICY